MGNTTTPGRGGALALLLAVASACSAGSDPDPREVAATLVAPSPRRSDLDGPKVVVAEWDASQTPSGPTAETTSRDDVPAFEGPTIAVGHNAVHAIDPTVQRAVAEAFPQLAGNYVACGDRDAVELLMVGRADFVVIGGALSPRETQSGLCQTRIGIELFALAVAQDSPVRSLSRTQVRQVLSGEVTQWQQLGYDGGDITVVAPSDRNLAERAAHTLLPGDDFASTAMRVDSAQQVATVIQQNRGAIGIVHVLDEPPEAGQRLLQIDWTSPTAEAFAYGTYPFGQPVHLVSSGPPSGSGLRFLEFTRSEVGRSLLQRSLLLH